MIANKKHNVDTASLQDKKLLCDFAKEVNFDVKGLGRKYTRDNILIKLPQSLLLRLSASGV